MALSAFSSIVVLSLIGQTAFPEPIFISVFPISSDAALKDGTVEIEARVDGRDFAVLRKPATLDVRSQARERLGVALDEQREPRAARK